MKPALMQVMSGIRKSRPWSRQHVQEASGDAIEKSGSVFLTPEALAINEARLCHLASLGLDIRNKRVLEVGGGIGLHSCFFESQGCDLLFTEARVDNLEEARRRYPHRKTALLNLDEEHDLTRFGTFDIIYCYGTLYHLTDPAKALRALAAVCSGLLLLETCVSPGDECLLNPQSEPASIENQAFTGMGCRPTRPWVLRELRTHMGFAYQTKTQPVHHDFETNWLKPAKRKLYRAVFVGSKTAVSHPLLSEVPCVVQRTISLSSGAVWLDVGAHRGESSLESARTNPALQVYAFEPNPSLAIGLFNRSPNYHALPVAVSEQRGLASFVLNSCTAASSVLQMDKAVRKTWIGGDQLAEQQRMVVPAVRLDDVMNSMDIGKVDLLKIDAQGGDFSALKSIGERLTDVRVVKLEVAITSQQLYVGAGTKSEITDYMGERGFALVAEQPQTHGQEENLVFCQNVMWTPTEFADGGLNSFANDADMQKSLSVLDEERLVQVAEECAPVASLRRVSGWRFDSYLDAPTPSQRFRYAIWNVFRERKVSAPVVFPWLHGLKLNLHLGNDISLPTFVSGSIDPNEFYLLDRFLSEGMTVFDIGANEGFYTVFAANRVGQTGRVIAFEPSARERRRLDANVSLNDLSNVTVEGIGLADREEQAVLRICEYGHEGQNTIGGFAYDVKQAETQAIRLRSLDSYLHDHPVDRLDLIKVDVEGAEERVFRGARETLERFQPVLLLEMNEKSLRLQGSSCRNVEELLQSTGYRLYSFASATGALVAAQDGVYSENVVAIHRDKVDRAGAILSLD